MFNLTVQNKEISMTSLEISELTGSRHDSVKRSIVRLSDSAVIARPPMVVEQFIDGNGQKRFVDVLVFSGEEGKRDSFVVVARISPQFMARIVDRWMELESKSSLPALPNFSNPAEAARAWADQIDLVQEKDIQLEMQQPKVDHYDRIVESKNLLNATEVALKVGRNPRGLNVLLEKLDVYNRSVQRVRVFKTWFIQQGYGVMKTTINGRTQAMFTMKGEAWVVQQVRDLEV